MMGGLDGGRRLLEQGTSKPKNLSVTLGRFGQYFARYWYGLALALVFIVLSTWTQVTAPEILGQAVACYLFPGPGSVCWFATVDPAATIEQKVAGLGVMALALTGLFILGAVASGLGFYAMRWTGENVLKRIRQDLFRKLQRLSIGFYAEHEAGDLMSRVTSDTDAIQQAFGFALLNVHSGALMNDRVLVKMLEIKNP